MESYTTTKLIGKIVAVVGWIALALGAIFLFVALGASNYGFNILALTPGFSMIIAGLVLICQGQITQAIVDTANYSAMTARNTSEILTSLRAAGDKLMAQRTSAASEQILSHMATSDTTNNPRQQDAIGNFGSNDYRIKEDKELMQRSLSEIYGVDTYSAASMMAYWQGKIVAHEKAQLAENSGTIIIAEDINGQYHSFYPANIIKELKDKLDANRASA